MQAANDNSPLLDMQDIYDRWDAVMDESLATIKAMQAEAEQINALINQLITVGRA